MLLAATQDGLYKLVSATLHKQRKLESLLSFAEFQVCVDYDDEQNPIYKTLPGWEQETSGIRHFNDLPQAAQDYIIFIEGVLDCPVGIVSVGPSRDQTIYRA